MSAPTRSATCLRRTHLEAPGAGWALVATRDSSGASPRYDVALAAPRILAPQRRPVCQDTGPGDEPPRFDTPELCLREPGGEGSPRSDPARARYPIGTARTLTPSGACRPCACRPCACRPCACRPCACRLGRDRRVLAGRRLSRPLPDPNRDEHHRGGPRDERGDQAGTRILSGLQRRSDLWPDRRLGAGRVAPPQAPAPRRGHQRAGSTQVHGGSPPPACVTSGREALRSGRAGAACAMGTGRLTGGGLTILAVTLTGQACARERAIWRQCPFRPGGPLVDRVRAVGPGGRPEHRRMVAHTCSGAALRPARPVPVRESRPLALRSLRVTWTSPRTHQSGLFRLGFWSRQGARSSAKEGEAGRRRARQDEKGRRRPNRRQTDAKEAPCWARSDGDCRCGLGSSLHGTRVFDHAALP